MFTISWDAKEVRPEKKALLLQQNNARCHASLKRMEHLGKSGWTFLPNPPYSLNLVPFDLTVQANNK